VIIISETPITRRKFLLRLNKLARIALANYGLESVSIKFITYSGNGLYQIRTDEKDTVESEIESGKYTLRLHQPDYMKEEYIVSEMEWLSALHNEGICVPKPIKNLEGKWITYSDGGYEVPQARKCTVLSWTEGRILGTKIKPKHFKALGKVIGQLHEQSQQWKPPKGFVRPNWDWEGLFGEGFSYGVPAVDARNAIPKVHQDSFNESLDRVREVSDQLGKGRDVYGLIHADLGVADNVSFYAGEARPFDFDDCGFGYWLFDFGVPLAQYFIDTDDKSQTMQNALLSGYEETSSSEGIGVEYLETFMAARIAQLMFFYQASALANPRYKSEAKVEINNHAKYLKYILKRTK